MPYNKVILIGNITRDIELRYTPKGIAVAKIGMAINRKWKDSSGQSKEEVTFVDIDAFNKQAEVVSQYVKKGSQLMIEGRLKTEQWEDKQTQQKRSKLGVVLESFTFLGSRGEPKPGQAPGDVEPPPAQGVGADDDIPF